MNKVYWNKAEIPIPPEAYRHKSDLSVRIKIMGVDGKLHEKTIGYFTSETHMHPNEFFRMKYQDKWDSFYGNDELHPSEVYMGIYALSLGIGYKTNIYPIIQKVYGPQWGNAFMDYAMYNILFKTDVTQSFPELMSNRVLFSRKIYSDSDYSELFKLATKDYHHNLRCQWLQHCADIGISKVWICIDGSNIDNQVKDSDYSENGFSKSHNHKPIVGFMYAVSSVNGMPITYLVYEGGTVDSVKFLEMVDLLSGYNIDVEGVILDRGFCTDSVITVLQAKSIDFVIMMPIEYHGAQYMKEKYASTIRDKSFYAVDDEGVFGISEEVKLFTKSETKAYVNLYYDRVRGSIQSTAVHKVLRKEKKRLENLIQQGKIAIVSSGMEKYFTINKDKNNNQELIINHETWDTALVAKGYFTIISSKPFGAEKVLQIYELRETSEVQYSILKSQEGYDTTRVHSTSGIRSKFACSFISGIIRCEIEQACKGLDLDTNVMIQRTDSRVRLFLNSPNSYALSRAFRNEELALLGCFSINVEHLEQMAEAYTKRFGSEANNQVRKIPHISAEPQERKRPGRPKGRKNNKTLQREAEELRRKAYTLDSEQSLSKNKGGRPKGSKDRTPRKRRTQKELQESATA